MAKLKVDMVSRELGRHKGDPAHLLLDAKMVERAIAAARAISAHCGYSVSVFDSESEEIISRMIDHIMENMHTPAVDLLSDYNDEYTASGKRVTEMRVNNPNGDVGLLYLTVSLRREPPAAVRVSGINIEIKQTK